MSTPNTFSFVESENQILNFWQQNSIFEKSMEQTKNGSPYIFYDGPPFATGLPHHGHLVGSTLKDVIPRYFTMKGFHVDRRFGWDCHGLPIEHEIDKKLGMSAHDAVKELGIAGYSNECRGIVQKYTSEWKKTIDRMGRWVSFDRQYKTMDFSYMESVWWVFKSLWDKDLVYQSTKVMPFSTSLGTVLSNFEAGLNYQTVQDPAVTVLFQIKDSDEYIAAWTTTPWTLPSNLALCVNEEIDYSLVEDEHGRKIYFASARLEAYKKKNLKVIKENIKGLDLKGKKYIPLFDYFSELESEGAFQVIADGYVTTESGTGIVHNAPSFGEDDERVTRESGIKANVCPVLNSGKFHSDVKDFAGMHIKDADKEIIKHLKASGALFDHSSYSHSYPFCYRSNTPLIYKAVPSWYVNVTKVKGDMIKANQEINWTPEHLKNGRFGKWLDNARDWAVSRNRVWGTPIPIWHNEENGKFLCIGSAQELAKYSGFEAKDLHRETVDDIEIKVDGEPGVYKRIPEVLDCWFESGSMPYAQLHYPFENKDVFEKGFPAEFIAEGLDQTRGWFYTLTVLAAALFKKPAFKNVIVNGLVLAQDGKKMSKSLRNYTDPSILMEKYGADALRLFLINSALVKGEDLKFTDDGVKDMVRRVLLPWYNSFKFFQTYADVDKWKPNVALDEFEPTEVLDKWIISKLQTLVEQVNSEMNQYHLYNVIPPLFDFIDDLTNWYIRLNRKRFWASDGEAESLRKGDAYHTLYFTLKEISKLMAPFAPFLSEKLFQELGKLSTIDEKVSVHLCTFPELIESLRLPALEDAVKRMQEVILLGRTERLNAKIKVKTPLKDILVIHRDEKILSEMKQLESALKVELNIKNVNYSTDEYSYIELKALPNSPVLGKKLGKDFGKYRNLISKLSTDDILNLEEVGTIEIGDQTFDQNEILVQRQTKEGSSAVSNKYISIVLNTELSKDLIKEGMAREILNRIQKTRKEIDFKVDQRVKMTINCDAKLRDVIENYTDYLKSEALIDEISFTENELKFKFDIDEQKLEINLV